MQRATPLYSEYMTSEEDFPGFSFFFFVSSGRLSEINKHEDVDVVFFLSFFPQRQNRPGSYHHKREGGGQIRAGKTNEAPTVYISREEENESFYLFPPRSSPGFFLFLRFGGVLWSSDQGGGGTDDAFSKGLTHKG